jgi:hypothetical protein
MIKKICIRLLLVLFIIGGLNAVYNFTLYDSLILEKYPEKFRILKTQDSAEVFYFGESSNVTYSETDSIKNSISEMTNFFFPTLKIQTITKYATHAGIYKYWLKEFDLNKQKPKAIIVTLNLRSFDAGWIHSKLETQLQESMVLTKSYPTIINRFLLSLQAFDNKTEQERELDMLNDWKNTELIFPQEFKYKTVAQWDRAMAAGGYLKTDGSWDMAKINLACHFIKSYAFNLNESNPRIKDFDEISQWCDENKINLYLNLMAENYQFADSLVGKELVFLMRQNRDFLVKRYSNSNCKVVDNLESVDGKEFIDIEWTTEHYRYKGRMRIAKNLANSLKDQFKNAYKEVY